jgi:hypothetical protein
MRYFFLKLLVSCVISIILITAFWVGIGISQYAPEIPLETSSPIPPLPEVPPEGWIVFEEDNLILFQGEPERLFHEARKNFFKKEMEVAATEIHKAALFMKLQAERATTAGKAPLMLSVHELEMLADAVEKRTVASVKKLDHSFAQAHLTLAKHHYLKAKEWFSKKNPKKVSHDLFAAAMHLENSLVWSGHEIEAGVVAAIKEVCFVTGKTIEVTGWSLEEKGKNIEFSGKGETSKNVGKAIERIGKEIVKLGRTIE